MTSQILTVCDTTPSNSQTPRIMPSLEGAKKGSGDMKGRKVEDRKQVLQMTPYLMQQCLLSWTWWPLRIKWNCLGTFCEFGGSNSLVNTHVLRRLYASYQLNEAMFVTLSLCTHAAMHSYLSRRLCELHPIGNWVPKSQNFFT